MTVSKDTIVANAPIFIMTPGEEYFPMIPDKYIPRCRFRKTNNLFFDDGYDTENMHGHDHWDSDTNSYDDEYYEVPVEAINAYGMVGSKNVRPKDSNAVDSDQYFLDAGQPDGKDTLPGLVGVKSPTGKAPIYYYIGKETGHSNISIVTYWAFYGFNHHVNTHQGDWERLAYRFDENENLLGVWYYAHGDPKYIKTADLPRDANGRILAYTAYGSHASYPDLGDGGIHPSSLDFVSSEGVRWDTAKLCKPLNGQPWANYAGAWGNYDNGDGIVGQAKNNASLIADAIKIFVPSVVVDTLLSAAAQFIKGLAASDFTGPLGPLPTHSQSPSLDPPPAG